MGEIYKVLGQLDSALTTIETIYTVPGATSSIVSTIIACNTTATAVTYRLYVVKSGGSATVANAAYYDLTIPGNDTFASTVGMTLATGDKIQSYSSAAHVCTQIFGSEVS